MIVEIIDRIVKHLLLVFLQNRFVFVNTWKSSSDLVDWTCFGIFSCFAFTLVFLAFTLFKSFKVLQQSVERL